MGKKGVGFLVASAPPLIALVTFCLVLKTFDVPSHAAWTARGYAAIIVAGLALVATIAVWLASRRQGRSDRDAKLYEACVQLAAQVDERCPRIPLPEFRSSRRFWARLTREFPYGMGVFDPAALLKADLA
jgi:uncharacterized SAM-binding protein YcdF (DUF218 family)